MQVPRDTARQIAAWSVHLFTATGAACCVLALDAGRQAQWRTALLWLALAVLIDAVDGTLARLAHVKELLPQFDGALLDNLVDYGSYVLVPAVLLHWTGLLPGRLSLPVAAVVCMASAYQFCQADAKTTDHYFKGFPSYWNIVLLYLVALQLTPAFNLAIVVTLVVLVFVPIKYLYPSRTLRLRRLTLTLTLCWAALLGATLWQLPNPNRWILLGSLAYVAYYVAASLYCTRTDAAKST